jgi:hypothetical protein
MKDIESYRSKRIAMEMLSAYVLFLEQGISAVERVYPQHKSFVLSNAGKSQSQVKRELLNQVAH